MVHETWVVGGITVPHVREASINQSECTITLSCSALNWNIVSPNTDVRDEIAAFEAIASEHVNNEKLLNGGTKLQVGNGEIITVTDGTDTYSRCALERIQINEDKVSTKRIDYELVIHYELDAPGGSAVYTPDYREYSNIEYYCWTDKGSEFPTHFAQGNEIGWMEITETSNVVAVEVYGSACAAFASYPNWIDCNGEKRYWHYSHDEGDWGPEDNTLPYGWEKLRWEITPSTTVILQTSTHDSSDREHPEEWTGCWLQWVRLIFG